MEKFNGFEKYSSSLYVRYSTQKFDNSNCQKIINEKNKIKKHKLIDDFVKKLSKNNNKTGFFQKNDEIIINKLFMQSFKIDDNSIYYNFFDNLETILQTNKKYTTATINAIIKTENDYFGKVANSKTIINRAKISQCYFDKNDEIVIPSIKSFKNKNCVACVEYSSVAHNLFMLAGFKSYYVLSRDAKFQGSNTQDGHAFLLVKNESKKCLLFDAVNNKIMPLQKNPIEDMFNNQPFMVGNDCYANASCQPMSIDIYK